MGEKMGDGGGTPSRQWRPDTALEMGISVGDAPTGSRTIRAITDAGWIDSQAQLDANSRAWFDVQGFQARAGTSAYAPDSDGSPGDIWLGVSSGQATARAYAALAARLPAGHYRIGQSTHAVQAALGWALGDTSSIRGEPQMRWRRPPAMRAPSLPHYFCNISPLMQNGGRIWTSPRGTIRRAQGIRSAAKPPDSAPSFIFCVATSCDVAH